MQENRWKSANNETKTQKLTEKVDIEVKTNNTERKIFVQKTKFFAEKIILELNKCSFVCVCWKISFQYIVAYIPT